MKKEVKTFRMVMKDDGVININLPDKPSFYFETGIRRSIAVIPLWTSWQVEQLQKPEEIYSYKLIFVYNSFEAKIDSTTISVSQLEDYFKSTNTSSLGPLIRFITDCENDGFNKRTEDQFIADYAKVIVKHFDEYLGLHSLIPLISDKVS